VPPHTRGSVSHFLTGVRAKAWCLLMHAEASPSRGAGSQGDSLAPPDPCGRFSLTECRKKTWCLFMHTSLASQTVSAGLRRRSKASHMFGQADNAHYVIQRMIFLRSSNTVACYDTASNICQALTRRPSGSSVRRYYRNSHRQVGSDRYRKPRHSTISFLSTLRSILYPVTWRANIAASRCHMACTAGRSLIKS